jgi:hypothetical protein
MRTSHHKLQNFRPNAPLQTQNSAQMLSFFPVLHAAKTYCPTLYLPIGLSLPETSANNWRIFKAVNLYSLPRINTRDASQHTSDFSFVLIL